MLCRVKLLNHTNERSSPLFAPLRICVIFLLIFGISEVLETPSVIDPGHGGSKVAGSLKTRSNSSPNDATTAGGSKEEDLTLESSKILKEGLLREAGSQGKRDEVLLTREADRNLDFVQRATIANRPDTACVVSIHFNPGGGKIATGSLAPTDGSVIGLVLSEGETIGTSDDVIVSVFQADDGVHWSVSRFASIPKGKARLESVDEAL